MLGCFSPLNKAYGQQIENLMSDHVAHITKDNFFPAFHTTYNIAMTERNIQAGFQGAALVSFDPESVPMTRAPTPSNSRSTTARDWTSQTPKDLSEAISQSTLIKSRIIGYHDSSPTNIYNAVDQIEKGHSL